MTLEQHKLSTDRVRQSLLMLPIKPERHIADRTLRDRAAGIWR
jgi:hypothetical protein